MARLLAFLGDLPCAGETRFGTALRNFATRTRNPGLVILISDLLGAEDAEEGIEALRYCGHDVVVIQLLAEAEIDPPLDGALRLVDAETGDELEVTVDDELRRLYRPGSSAASGVESFCRKRGVEYLRASTAIAFEDVVLKYLRQGRTCSDPARLPARAAVAARDPDPARAAPAAPAAPPCGAVHDGAVAGSAEGA